MMRKKVKTNRVAKDLGNGKNPNESIIRNRIDRCYLAVYGEYEQCKVSDTVRQQVEI